MGPPYLEYQDGCSEGVTRLDPPWHAPQDPCLGFPFPSPNLVPTGLRSFLLQEDLGTGILIKKDQGTCFPFFLLTGWHW